MLRLENDERFDIENKQAALTEPSGLVLTDNDGALLVVDDDSGNIFKLDLDGRLIETFEIDAGDLEGITVTDDGSVFAVGEKGNQILRIDLANRTVPERKTLEQMKGYGPIRALIEDGDPKKGLEGIAWCSKSGSLFCVRESGPCLLIEIDTGLEGIVSHRILDHHNGFSDLHNGEIDFSGICYDPGRDAFWIISHKAHRVFLYSWKENRVLDSARVEFERDGKMEPVDQVEGVAIDTKADRLYTVCDETCRLYIHDIRDRS